MAHEIDMSNNRANIAFLGSRNDVWHRLGTEMKPGQTLADWQKAAGLDWQVVKVPAIAHLAGKQFDHIPAEKRFMPVEGWNHLCRLDTGAPLGYGSDGYQEVQPDDLFQFASRYVGVDDRFKLDTAGSLRGGALIWIMATFAEGFDIAGSKHVARLLMSTTFDASGATINQATMDRVVCKNTFNVATADKRAVIRTRHNAAFNANRVAKELSDVCLGFDNYATMGNAMALTDMARTDVSAFFKGCLDIPFDAKESDLSTRKRNQFAALSDAYRATVNEGTEAGKVWTAFNAITRYVDHDRSTRQTEGNEAASRFASAQFGSGADLKAKAWNLLLPAFKDRVKIAA